MNSFDELIGIFTAIDDEDTMKRLFAELFTEKECKAFTLRWDLLKDLYHGETQRNIAARHRISLCKITRGSRILKEKDSAVAAVLREKYGERK